jgi:hypothetical protein
MITLFVVAGLATGIFIGLRRKTSTSHQIR